MCACEKKEPTVLKTGAQLRSAASGQTQRLIPREAPIKTRTVSKQTAAK